MIFGFLSRDNEIEIEYVQSTIFLRAVARLQNKTRRAPKARGARGGGGGWGHAPLETFLI